MAPADTLSPPGSSTYHSDTMDVGDGTWVFNKNTFLLPPLVGPNFETMRANGMAQRFSTFPQYHKLIMAHAVLAILVFLFIVPTAVMVARFHRGSSSKSYRYHAYLNIIAIGLTTASFILGCIAVGPRRSLTNPHHGIGVAIYTLLLVQAIGGTLIKKIRRRSMKVMIHRWIGRAIALLGIVQIPLGLTLYGSPKPLFILYALWMAVLLLTYFLFSYEKEAEHYLGPGGTRSEITTTTDSSEGGGMGWLAPAAAIAAFLAWRHKRKANKSARAASPSHSSDYTYSHGPTSTAPTTYTGATSYTGTSYTGGGTESYITDDKYSDVHSKQHHHGRKLLGAGIAGGIFAKLFSSRKKREQQQALQHQPDYHDDYSSVSGTTAPPPKRGSRVSSYKQKSSAVSDYSDVTEEGRGGRRTPLLPPPVQSGLSSEAPSHRRPMHRPRPGPSAVSTIDDSDYSSYISASPSKNKRHSTGSTSKGLLAGLGLGWLGGNAAAKKPAPIPEERYEPDRRNSGSYGRRYSGEPRRSPSRRVSKRVPPPAPRMPPPAPSEMTDSTWDTSVLSSAVDSRPPGSAHTGAMTAASSRHTVPSSGITATSFASSKPSRSRSRNRTEDSAVQMPVMPNDPQGILAPIRSSGRSRHSAIDSEDSESHLSGGSSSLPPQRRRSQKRRAAQEAAATASRLAEEEEQEAAAAARRRNPRNSGNPGAGSHSSPVGVSLKMHSDPDRTVTVRQLTDEELRERERDRRHSRGKSSTSRRRSESTHGAGAPPTTGRSSRDSSATGTTPRYRRPRPPRRGSVNESDLEGGPPVEPPMPINPPAPVRPPVAGAGSLVPPSHQSHISGDGRIATPPKPVATPLAPADAPYQLSEPMWAPLHSNAAENRERRRAERRRNPPPPGPEVEYD